MRMGGKRIDWTMDDVAFLIRNAGRMPKREICRRLRRSSESVKQMAKRLRAQGHPVDLRYFEPRSTICPSCGRASATMRETGICRPCQLRRQLTAIEGTISDLMERLPADVRATYEDTEAERDARVIDPRPQRPRYDEPPSYYRRMVDEEAYDMAMEQWETRRMQRAVKAAQKRKERIRARLRKVTNRPNE